MNYSSSTTLNTPNALNTYSKPFDFCDRRIDPSILLSATPLAGSSAVKNISLTQSNILNVAIDFIGSASTTITSVSYGGVLYELLNPLQVKSKSRLNHFLDKCN